MKKPDKRGTRPPRPPAKPKSMRIEIRTTEAETQAYQNAASAAGLETTVWMRQALNAAAKRQLTGT